LRPSLKSDTLTMQPASFLVSNGITPNISYTHMLPASTPAHAHTHTHTPTPTHTHAPATQPTNLLGRTQRPHTLATTPHYPPALALPVCAQTARAHCQRHQHLHTTSAKQRCFVIQQGVPKQRVRACSTWPASAHTRHCKFICWRAHARARTHAQHT